MLWYEIKLTANLKNIRVLRLGMRFRKESNFYETHIVEKYETYLKKLKKEVLSNYNQCRRKLNILVAGAVAYSIGNILRLYADNFNYTDEIKMIFSGTGLALFSIYVYHLLKFNEIYGRKHAIEKSLEDILELMKNDESSLELLDLHMLKRKLLRRLDETSKRTKKLKYMFITSVMSLPMLLGLRSYLIDFLDEIGYLAVLYSVFGLSLLSFDYFYMNRSLKNETNRHLKVLEEYLREAEKSSNV